jgi:hypothetical protein
MRDVEPEDLREHAVDVGGQHFPPKQVMAVVTGWQRQTFTTMEAQRVLTRAGLRCMRTTDLLAPSTSTVIPVTDNLLDRLHSLETAVRVLNEAVAGLSQRLGSLEGGA